VHVCIRAEALPADCCQPLVPHVTLLEVGWNSWPVHNYIVSVYMHLDIVRCILVSVQVVQKLYCFEQLQPS